MYMRHTADVPDEEGWPANHDADNEKRVKGGGSTVRGTRTRNRQILRQERLNTWFM